MKNLLAEFRAFAMKGNVVDLAVGIIIGVAFGKIVSSVVNDIIMPPIGLLIGGMNFSDLKIILKDAIGENPAVSINYGLFIQSLIDFVVIAFVIFIIVKAMNATRKKEVPSPAPPSNEEIVLKEIRDILKSK